MGGDWSPDGRYLFVTWNPGGWSSNIPSELVEIPLEGEPTETEDNGGSRNIHSASTIPDQLGVNPWTIEYLSNWRSSELSAGRLPANRR